ncbi:MAG TPA: hypothetical protein VK658_21430 [Chryseolinea sp.]|nr:hypothetical protein [Chryseolinea sp.]
MNKIKSIVTVAAFAFAIVGAYASQESSVTLQSAVKWKNGGMCEDRSNCSTTPKPTVCQVTTYSNTGCTIIVPSFLK